MKVEMFFTQGCTECAAAREGLKDIAEKTVSGIQWRDVSVLDELDYAVELGVLTLPSIVIDGELAFSSLPTPRQLRDALIRQEGRES